MEVTDFGINIDCKLRQSKKALFAIDVTELGIIMDTSDSQYWNSSSSIAVRPVKYCNSSNEVMGIIENAQYRFVTAAASS